MFKYNINDRVWDLKKGRGVGRIARIAYEMVERDSDNNEKKFYEQKFYHVYFDSAHPLYSGRYEDELESFITPIEIWKKICLE